MEFILPLLPLIIHCFCDMLEQEVECEICAKLEDDALILFSPRKSLERKVRDNIFKTKTLPSEVNRRKAVGGFSSIKPQSN